jgi:hypothetical protein
MSIYSKSILLFSIALNSSCAVKGIMTDIPNTSEKMAVDSKFFAEEPSPGTTYDEYNKNLTRTGSVTAEFSIDNIKLRLVTPSLIKLRKYSHIIDEQKKLGKSQSEIDSAVNTEIEKELKTFTDNKVCFDFNFIPKSITGQTDGAEEKYWASKISANGQEVPSNLKINKGGVAMTTTTYYSSGYQTNSSEWSEFTGTLCSDKKFEYSNGVSVELSPRFYKNQTVVKNFEWSTKPTTQATPK